MTDRAWGDDHLTQIRQAAARIQNHVRRTPLLGNDISTGLLVKPESLQVTGSFKARGAFNAVLSLLEREPDVAGVVTHSSGNHGQALARAAQAAGLPATIVVPQGVTPAKIEGIRSFGATVVSEDVTFDNREAIAERIARAQRLRLIARDLEQAQGCHRDLFASRLRDFEAQADVALTREMINFRRLHLRKDATKRRAIGKIAVMEEEPVTVNRLIRAQMVDTGTEEIARSPNDTMNRVSFLEEQLRQIRAILTGDARNQRRLRLCHARSMIEVGATSKAESRSSGR